MESFFLSETLKYLFLLFDDENVLHTRAKDFVFTTQVGRETGRARVNPCPSPSAGIVTGTVFLHSKAHIIPLSSAFAGEAGTWDVFPVSELLPSIMSKEEDSRTCRALPWQARFFGFYHHRDFHRFLRECVLLGEWLLHMGRPTQCHALCFPLQVHRLQRVVVTKLFQ